MSFIKTIKSIFGPSATSNPVLFKPLDKPLSDLEKKKEIVFNEIRRILQNEDYTKTYCKTQCFYPIFDIEFLKVNLKFRGDSDSFKNLKFKGEDLWNFFSFEDKWALGKIWGRRYSRDMRELKEKEDMEIANKILDRGLNSSKILEKVLTNGNYRVT